MTSRDFVYWFQGFLELRKTIDHREGLSEDTVKVIQNHLNLVFKHEIDPSMGEPKKQQELNTIHTGGLNLPGFPTDMKIRC